MPARSRSGWRDATARLSAGAPAILDAAAGLPGFAYDRLLAEAVLAFGLDELPSAKDELASEPISGDDESETSS